MARLSRNWAPLLSILCFMASGAAMAQDSVCDRSKSLSDCFVALNKKLEKEKTKEKESDRAREVRNQEVADTTAMTAREVADKSSANALDADSANLRDALSTFAAAAGADSEDGATQVVFDQKIFEPRWGCEAHLELDDTSSSDTDEGKGRCLSIPIQLRAEATQGEVLTALAEAIPEEVREDRVASLEKDIEDFDALDLQLRASFEGGTGTFRWGRNAETYQDIVDDLYQGTVDPTTEESKEAKKYLAWQASLERWLESRNLANDIDPWSSSINNLATTLPKDLSSAIKNCEEQCRSDRYAFIAEKARCEGVRHRLSHQPAWTDPDRSELASCIEFETQAPPPMNCPSACGKDVETQTLAYLENEVQTGIALLDSAVTELFEARRKNWKALSQGKFSQFASLVDNQPQAYLEINHRERGTVTGPDESSLKVVFEFGLVNVNRLQKWAPRNLTGDCKVWNNSKNNSKKSLGCLSGYLKKKGGNLDDGSRFSLSVERVEVDDFAFALPEDGVDFQLDAVDKTIIALGYGRRLDFDGEGKELTRFDLKVSHEDVSDDLQRDDRTLAELTLTRKLIGDFSLSLSLNWANKPEYLVDDDGEELGGRIAIGWKVLTGKKDDKS